MLPSIVPFGHSRPADRRHRGWLVLAACLAAGVVAGCAAYGPGDLRAGASEADVIARMGSPTGRHAMPDGRTRLEFARGPFGRETFMVDLDTAGRVAGIAQVLGETQFMALQVGMTADEVLREFGRPAERRRVGFVGREVWSWRYPTNDCLWFRVTFGPDGRTFDAGGYLPDPMCDPPSDRR
jgi:hypothetical protein